MNEREPGRAEDLGAARRFTAFAALMAVYAAYAFCWNTENFLRPYIADALHLSRAQVASFYSAQAAGALLGAVTLPQVADRSSRRNLLALCAFGFGLAAIGALLVDSYSSALAQRFAMGVFLGGVFGCTVSLYVGLFPPAMRGLMAGIVQLVYNGGDATLSWIGRHFAADWQIVMAAGGAGAIVAAGLVMLFTPDDRRVLPWGSISPRPDRPRRSSIVELFDARYLAVTLRLALMCGLNFFAFQAFNGWITTYLKEFHQFGPDEVGRLLTVLHIGSMIGAIAWGMLADRIGRRFNAAGFLLCAILIVVYITVPPTFALLAASGFAYGLCLAASSIWGPYFAEMYPEHLRATAASIFNWGRIVSLFGAIVAGLVAERFGLVTIMLTGAVAFVAAAVVWWSLPETVARRVPTSNSA